MLETTYAEARNQKLNEDLAVQRFRLELGYLMQNLRSEFGPRLVYNTNDRGDSFKIVEPENRRDLGLTSLVEFIKPLLNTDSTNGTVNYNQIWKSLQNLDHLKNLSSEQKSVIKMGLFLLKVSEIDQEFLDRVNSNERISEPSPDIIRQFIEVGRMARIDSTPPPQTDPIVRQIQYANIDITPQREAFTQYLLKDLKILLVVAKSNTRNSGLYPDDLVDSAKKFLDEFEFILAEKKAMVNGRSDLFYRKPANELPTYESKSFYVRLTITNLIDSEHLLEIFEVLTRKYFSEVSPSTSSVADTKNYLKEFVLMNVAEAGTNNSNLMENDKIQAYWYPLIRDLLIDLYAREEV